MALNLSTTGIVDGQIITAAQITQSINALTGTVAYDITVSGSFVLNGGTTGSGTFNRSVQTSQVEPNTVIPLTNSQYNLAFFNSTSSVATPLKWSGTGPSFNPVTETLKVTNLLGTASFCASASLAQTASFLSGFPTQFAPSYVDISSGTNPPANPYNVVIGNKSFVFLNQIAAGSIGLLFLPSSQDGQIVNFAVSNVQATSLDYAAISITASGVAVFGYNNLNVPLGGNDTLGDIIVNPAVNYRNGFQFMYKTTPVPGWYYVSYGQ
jgi:hypothetical protein